MRMYGFRILGWRILRDEEFRYLLARNRALLWENETERFWPKGERGDRR